MGDKKYGKRRRHGNSAFRRHSRVSTFDLSPRLGSAREIGSTQASASWTLVTPPAAAVAAVAPYRCYGCSLQPPPLLLAATAAVAVFGLACHCRRRRPQPLSLSWSSLTAPITAAVAPCLLCRCLLPPPPPSLPPRPSQYLAAPATAAAINGGRCRCRRCRQPFSASPPAAAAAAASGRTPGGEGHCHRVESLTIAVGPSHPLPVGLATPPPAPSLSPPPRLVPPP